MLNKLIHIVDKNIARTFQFNIRPVQFNPVPLILIFLVYESRFGM